MSSLKARYPCASSGLPFYDGSTGCRTYPCLLGEFMSEYGTSLLTIRGLYVSSGTSRCKYAFLVDDLELY